MSTLKPKPGVSTLYEKAEKVLAQEGEEYGATNYVLFHLRMPPTFLALGMDSRHVIVAVPVDQCEEVW